MKKLLAWRHVAYEDLDGFAPAFHEHGYDLAYWNALYDGDLPDPLAPDILVILGAPIGVYEAAEFPFIAQQIAGIRARLALGKPVLGICFGVQLLAAALGARVYKGPSFEFGWSPVALTDAGSTSAVSEYRGPVFHCHGDTFDLPRDATLLARSAQYENQAFSSGPHLGLQFHGEVTERGLSRWLIGHIARIKANGGLAKLREETQMHSIGIEARLNAFVRRWLADLP